MPSMANGYRDPNAGQMRMGLGAGLPPPGAMPGAGMGPAPVNIQLGGGQQPQPDQPPAGMPGQMPPLPPGATIDPTTNALMLPQDDGSMIIDFNPRAPLPADLKFDSNLAEYMDEHDLDTIAIELIEGVDADIQSRREWELGYIKGIELLGLKVEEASADVKNGAVSQVYHQMLLEAVIRYQSNGMAELLPVDGPVKIKDDEPDGNFQRDELAEAFEHDFNHYFTAVAKEYYPDFDRMLFSNGLCGNAFRKVYRCPLRKRPVSEWVPAPDLIVSNDCTDLSNAGRLTHRTKMRHSTVKRLMIAKHFRTVDLVSPTEQPTSIDEKIHQVQGTQSTPYLPADHRHELYECYAEFDPKEYNIPVSKVKGYKLPPDGLPVSFRVTIDKDSQKVLEIRCNWKKEDADFMPRKRFVKYGLIPGLGFYDYGYAHLLGNPTRAATAIERILLDAGQFACFPGFLLAKQGGRQESSDIRVPPGGGKTIETGGRPIGDVVLALPYKEPSQTLADVGQQIVQDAQRLAGVADIAVGEGKADVPVGTMLALIEQATKPLSAIHKRNHSSQAEELQMMRELFAEEPQALWKFAKNPRRQWQMAQEFADIELVPVSDPNTPSHIHRVMKATALIQLSSQAPSIYDLKTVHQAALRVVGFQDTQSFFNPPGPPPPDPKVQAAQAKAQSDQSKVQAQLQGHQIKAGLAAAQMQQDAQHKALDHQAESQKFMLELADRKAERDTRLQVESLRMLEDKIKSAKSLALDVAKHQHDRVIDHTKQNRENMKHAHEHGLAAVEHHREVADLGIRAHEAQTKRIQAEKPTPAGEGE